MPKMQIEKSIEIAAPAERVFEIVSDLGQWRPWNPWLVTDPEVVVNVEKGGKAYDWVGTRTGEGSMRIVGEEAPRLIQLDLVFLKPFKSKAKVEFEISSTQTGCTVTWRMNSKLPFFIFFLKKMMTTLIGMDYERGLSMLKDLVETGSVPSKIEYPGASTYPGCEYVGVSTECAISELGEKMSADFAKLKSWQDSTGTVAAGDAFSIYRKWDLSGGRVQYTSGFPVSSLPSSVPDPLETGNIPSIKTFVLEHVGPFRHLGNAWSAGMQMGRGKEFLQSKSHTPFETYPLGADGQLPGGDSNESTRTSIHFAVR